MMRRKEIKKEIQAEIDYLKTIVSDDLGHSNWLDGRAASLVWVLELLNND